MIAKSIALLLLVSLTGAGCRSTRVNTVEPSESAAQREVVEDRRIIKDRSLSKAVRVIGLNVAAGQEGFLKIQVEVENTSRSLKSFTCSVEWFDENGIFIDLPTANARPRSIEGGEILSITATAPTPRAKDFRIKFLEPVTK